MIISLQQLETTRSSLASASSSTAVSLATLGQQLSQSTGRSADAAAALGARVSAVEAALGVLQTTLTTRVAAAEAANAALGKDCYTAFRAVEERLGRAEAALADRGIKQESQAGLKATQVRSMKTTHVLLQHVDNVLASLKLCLMFLRLISTPYLWWF